MQVKNISNPDSVLALCEYSVSVSSLELINHGII